MTSQHELIPMRPGEILRFEREQKGLTLERAAADSRIKPTVLSAIEDGNTADIPSVYLKGYIRNYARYLGINPSEIEDRIEQVEGATPEVRTVFTVNSNRGRAEKWLKASSYLAASVLIAALAWQFTHEAVRFSQGDSALTASREAASPGNADTPNDEGHGARGPNTHLNASIASVEVLRERGELPAVSAAEQAWAAIGEGTETGTAGEGVHRLTVTTSADTWIEILGAGEKQLEMDLIRAGNSRAYTGPGPFRIMIGRASAVVITLDGEAIDLAPHTRGNVAHLTLAQTLAAEAGTDDLANPEAETRPDTH